MSLTEEARKAYKDMVSALEQEQAEEALKNDKKVPHHMGHSRNHSAASAISFCSIFSEPISEVNEKEYGKFPLFLSLCFFFFFFCKSCVWLFTVGREPVFTSFTKNVGFLTLTHQY